MRTYLTLLMSILMIFGSVSLGVSQAPPETISSDAAWLVYWDTNSAMEELTAKEKKFDQLIFFAGFFNPDDSLFIPDELCELKYEIADTQSQSNKPHYISFVNDYTLPEGGYLTKNVPLLKRLLQSGAQRSEDLAKEMVETAIDYDYQGIEIDFEALVDNISLWKDYISFINILLLKCDKNNLALRIVLEPRTPFAKIELPIGPDYVMMCYNLFGSHSDPGPKANTEFLRRLVGQMTVIPPENRRFALANGGNDWSIDRVKQVSYQEAENLRIKYGKKLNRTEEVVNFIYHDEEGKQHEIWYSDQQTIDYWTRVLNEAGEFKIDLWRLGGNLL